MARVTIGRRAPKEKAILRNVAETPAARPPDDPSRSDALTSPRAFRSWRTRPRFWRRSRSSKRRKPQALSAPLAIGRAPDNCPCAALHEGPCLAVMLDDRQDYFG